MGIQAVMYSESSERTNIKSSQSVQGEFITRENERFYAIRNINKMPVFFISVVSHSDHWLFVSSNGGVTAGRVSPETALFPYVPVDKVEDSTPNTGCKTLLSVADGLQSSFWEPFNEALTDNFEITRNLYKNVLGNKLCFEEINHDLQLAFRYTWKTSDTYGFVRDCELENLSGKTLDISLLDGFLNILPAATPREIQTNASNLVNAYKWNELDQQTGMGCYTLYSGISDKAAPAESMLANTVFSIGLNKPTTLLSTNQLANFRLGLKIEPESCIRGIRGAYLVNDEFKLAPSSNKQWQIIADVEKTQSQVVALRQELLLNNDLKQDIASSVDEGSENLVRIIAAVDGYQVTAEENVSVHHYANVLFNSMRGGVFDKQYQIDLADFIGTLKNFNQSVFEQHSQNIASWSDSLEVTEFLEKIKQVGDANLERLAYEYLPITFGRRHGDPSRPWNEFAIKLRDEKGDPLLSYQGNWRDIFQNWEALLFSYPEFIENIVTKFVNASTLDGYNPYRITKQGIDWEVQEPEDPWSYIGYWGDHQIIYLLKLLELSNDFHPGKLKQLLRHPIYCYANVPYRIKPFAQMCKTPKETVDYDFACAQEIEKRVEAVGADGKLIHASDGQVYQVNLLEKMLVPLLSKLGNLVPDGGIWLNAQRPEWNDANNALVGHGLSMVTLYYLRRHIGFLQNLLSDETESFELSLEVGVWLVETAKILSKTSALYSDSALSDQQRFEIFESLQQSADRYRQKLYQNKCFSGKAEFDIEQVKVLFADALVVIDESIQNNKREDGLYHAYNLLDLKQGNLEVDHLYLMLEGQVSALSSGAVPTEQVLNALESLYETDLYRDDQKSFILYPDRQLPSFLDKNCISQAQFDLFPAVQSLLGSTDNSILEQDVEGNYRFNATLINSAELDEKFDHFVSVNGVNAEAIRSDLQELYEQVFNHKEFTGRSGGMFGFEGLGSIYWHMVSKLLLTAQEAYLNAEEEGCDTDILKRLGQVYYRIREGIGFNKKPTEYGAFPTDPYSHTPKHAGAQQPGMTGQVKEEVLTRFGELGLQVKNGQVHIKPSLLRSKEFLIEPEPFTFIDKFGNNQTLEVPASGLGFTWCQIPFVYILAEASQPSIDINYRDGTDQRLETLVLSPDISDEIFKHTGKINRITLNLNSDMLFKD